MQEATVGQDKRKVVSLLDSLSIFRQFSENDFNRLLDTAKLQSYKPKEIIIKEGDYNNLVFFLINGSLVVIKDGNNLALLDQDGELFGEMGVLNNEPRSATIQAEKSSLVLCIDASIMKDKESKDAIIFSHILYRLFAEILSTRLRVMIEENSRLKKENELLKNR